MTGRSATIPPARGWRRPTLTVAAVSLPFLLSGLLAHSLHAPWSAVATTAPAHLAVAPLLILQPRVTHLTAVLGHGDVLRGTLEPTLPGLNTVRVTLVRPLGATQGGQIALAAIMQGMAMPPSRAVLQRDHGGAFTGTLRLPMFGDYRVVVTLHTPAGRATRTFTLALPFPHAS